MTIDNNPEGTKVCTKCKKPKSLSEYTKSGRGDGKLRSHCKECQKSYRKPVTPEKRAFYNGNRKKVYDPVKAKYDKLKRQYNLSPEQYDMMVMVQQGKCLICKREEELHVDHDHSCCPENGRSCGKCVRGLLCNNCNNGIGRFKDDIRLLISAANYLQYKWWDDAAKARGYVD
jgi:hypothetical protein